MDSEPRLIGTILLCSASLLPASPLFSQNETPPDDIARESLKVTQCYGALEQNYMDPVDPDKTILEGAVRGMLASLDPFSAFFNRSQFELLQQQARGEALGFGSVLYVQPGKVMVLQVAEGSPSWRAGLGPGDEIVAVNGTRIDRLDFDSLVELLQRSRSHPARLSVIHPGKLVSQDLDLKPAEVALPTLDKAFALSPGVGYVHLSGFEQKTAQEIVDAFTRLGGPSLRGLILDLRDNHGGIVDAAIGVASIFLKPDLLVLTVSGRATPRKSYRTTSGPFRFDGPLIVLVNGNTASAAEVVAASLQEHDRALIVGEPTFGKGAVEGVFPLSERTGLALTTAQYLTPSGRSIQRPLYGTAFAAAVQQKGDPAIPPSIPAFHTDNGRPVSAGGGITPDVQIAARTLDPWAIFLNQRGAFTSYASEYLTLHGKVEPTFEPDSKVLNDFKDYLTRQQIRAPDEYWNQDQDYLKLRIKTEIFNLVFGLSRGDEVEVRGDPQVQNTAMLFPKITDFLKPPALIPAGLQVKGVSNLAAGLTDRLTRGARTPLLLPGCNGQSINFLPTDSPWCRGSPR